MAAVLNNHSDGLIFSIHWQDPPTGNTAAALTEGVLEFRLADELVWSAADGFTWTWIELLEWLTLNWSRIELEDGLSFQFDPANAAELSAFVEREARDTSISISEELDVTLWDFLESHDLSRALQGATYRSLIIWREGRLGHILTDTTHARTGWRQLQETLERLGDEIVDRIGRFGASDGRAQHALLGWAKRRDHSASEVVAVASGLTDTEVNQLLQIFAVDPMAPWEFDAAGVEDNEILAVARMTSGLPSTVIATTLRQLAVLTKSSAPNVDAIANTLGQKLSGRPPSEPYEQGYAAAALLRTSTKLVAGSRFDPIAWLRDAGVEYIEANLNTPLIDAIACWGASRGPTVVVNLTGRHSQSAYGRNASVAHEIAHLLLDREGALPAAEVLGGRLNPTVEARARAFAAEVLMPRADAGEVIFATDAETVARAVQSLTRRYRVSRELVAWQARNSSFRFTDEVTNYLRSLVQTPRLF